MYHSVTWEKGANLLLALDAPKTFPYRPFVSECCDLWTVVDFVLCTNYQIYIQHYMHAQSLVSHPCWWQRRSLFIQNGRRLSRRNKI